MALMGRYRLDPEGNVKVKGGRPQKYTDEDMLEAMQQAAQQAGLPGGRLSYNGYKEWRLLQAASGGPTAEAIALRLGSWRRALARAGLMSPASPYRPFPFKEKPIDLEPARFGCRVFTEEEREAYAPADAPGWLAEAGRGGV